MSYDLEIGTHERPTREQIEQWAAAEDLLVTADEEDSFTIERRTRRGAAFVCTVDGPLRAEAEDFAEEVAAACLAPRWMLQISVPYSAPKASFATAGALARHLAEQNGGAAFDPQEDRLLWPRGRRRRVPRAAREEPTSKVGLEWFLPPSRWAAAPEKLVALLRRRCPEAQPTRYGQFEPPQHRYDHEHPDEFVRFLLENEDGDAFWFASRPSFGGSCFAPHADHYAPPEDDPYRIAHVQVDFDGRVLGSDGQWREAVVGLFVAGAIELGAFYGAAQVEPGWLVTRNNRLFMSAENVGQSDYFLRGRLWQGLPPVPVWLSWFGKPYRDLVLDHIRSHDVPTVTEHREGVFVRLSDEPLPRDELVALVPPRELTYTRRGPTEDAAALSWSPAEREDRAKVIPALDV